MFAVFSQRNPQAVLHPRQKRPTLYIFALLLLFVFSSFSISTTPVAAADRDAVSTSIRTSSTVLPCQSVIEPGMALNCALDVVAEVDTFSFNGSVGDVLLFRVRRVSNTLQPWLRIYDPNGLNICEGYAERFVEIDCTLSRSGVFTISISDSSAPRDKTGNYRLYMQRLNNPGRFASVNYGVRTTDEVAQPTEVDTYTFNGEVDDKLLLRMTRGSETVQPWLRLYTPAGVKLCEGYADRFFEIECTLPSTGRYTLIVADASAGRIETGAYSLEVQRLNNPGAGTAIAFGQTRSSRLDVPVRIATYTFSGTVDDVIFVRAYRISDELQPWARVYTPSGSELCEGFSERFIEFACQLPSSGSYTVIVSDATPLRELTGGYDLYIQRLNMPGLVQILGDYGQTVFDSIDQPTRVDTYVIDGKVDDQLLIRMRRLSDTIQPWMRVYSPTGVKICEGFDDRFFEMECTFPRTGRYTLLIADATPSRVETGAYSVYIQRLNNPGNPLPIGPGSGVTGAIQTPSGLDTYNFSGEVGARITIRMQRTSDTLQPWMRVYDPRGVKVCEAFNTTIAEIGTCELPRTGNYTLLVGDASPGRAELGDYALTFDCLSAGCSVSLPPTCSVGENGLDTCALQPGDILLQRWNSVENNILMTIGGTYFTHAAMYVGDGRVVEAVGPFALPEDQVIERSVSWWTNSAIYDWVVIRPKTTEQTRLSAVAYMRAMAADPQVTYSILAAKESDKEVYCSQLVWRAYQRIGLNLEVDRGGTIANIATLNRLVSPDDLFYSAGSLAQLSTIVQRRDSSIDRTVWRWTMWILSPAHLLLVDDQGRRTGYDVATGTTLEEIPGVVYSGPDAAVEMISITDPSGSSENWKLYVVGYDTGSYTIEAGSVDSVTPPVQVLSGTTQANQVEQYIIQDPGRSGTIDLQPAEPTRTLIYLPLLRR